MLLGESLFTNLLQSVEYAQLNPKTGCLQILEAFIQSESLDASSSSFSMRLSSSSPRKKSSSSPCSLSPSKMNGHRSSLGNDVEPVEVVMNGHQEGYEEEEDAADESSEYFTANEFELNDSLLNDSSLENGMKKSMSAEDGAHNNGDNNGIIIIHGTQLDEHVPQTNGYAVDHASVQRELDGSVVTKPSPPPPPPPHNNLMNMNSKQPMNGSLNPPGHSPADGCITNGSSDPSSSVGAKSCQKNASASESEVILCP